MSSKIKAKRTTTACDHCRRRKAKCDGNPMCISCDSLGLECSYGDRVKLRGPAYVAHLESKVDELKAQLQASQGHAEESAAAHGIPTPPDTLPSASDSSPGDSEGNVSGNQIFEPAPSLPLDHAIENTIAVPLDTLAPQSETLPSTWTPSQYDAQFGLVWPPYASEMDIPLVPSDNESLQAFPASDQSFMDEWTMSDPMPPTIPVKHEPDTDPVEFDVLMDAAIEEPSMTEDSYPSTRRRRPVGQDRAELRTRNRIAAAKCRSRNKAAHTKLENDARMLQNQNTQLNRQLLALRTQRSHLQELALQHDVEPSSQCHCVPIHQYNKEKLGQTISWA